MQDLEKHWQTVEGYPDSLLSRPCFSHIFLHEAWGTVFSLYTWTQVKLHAPHLEHSPWAHSVPDPPAGWNWRPGLHGCPARLSPCPPPSAPSAWRSAAPRRLSRQQGTNATVGTFQSDFNIVFIPTGSMDRVLTYFNTCRKTPSLLKHVSPNSSDRYRIFLTWRLHCISHTNVDGESLTSADPQPRKLTSPRACRLFTAPTMTWWSTPRLAATSKLSTPSSTFSIRRRSVSTTPVSAMLEPCEALKRPDVTLPPERPYVLE